MLAYTLLILIIGFILDWTWDGQSNLRPDH